MRKAADRVLSTTRTAYGVTSASAMACLRLDWRTRTSRLPGTNRTVGSCAAPGSMATLSRVASGTPACNGGLGE